MRSSHVAGSGILWDFRPINVNGLHKGGLVAKLSGSICASEPAAGLQKPLRLRRVGWIQTPGRRPIGERKQEQTATWKLRFMEYCVWWALLLCLWEWVHRDQPGFDARSRQNNKVQYNEKQRWHKSLEWGRERVLFRLLPELSVFTLEREHSLMSPETMSPTLSPWSRCCSIYSSLWHKIHSYTPLQDFYRSVYMSSMHPDSVVVCRHTKILPLIYKPETALHKHGPAGNGVIESSGC